MSVLAEIAIYVIRTIGSLYLLLVLLRFLFQLVRADFYNPISQTIAKATNPLLLPMRKVIPGFYGIDFASLILGLLVQALVIQIIFFVAGYGFIGVLNLIAWSFVGVLATFASIYFWGLIIVIIASWIAPFSQNPALVLVRQIIEPAMAPIRKIIPPLGVIDLSPIVAFMILHVINRYLIAAIAGSVNMPSGLVLGL